MKSADQQVKKRNSFQFFILYCAHVQSCSISFLWNLSLFLDIRRQTCIFILIQDHSCISSSCTSDTRSWGNILYIFFLLSLFTGPYCLYLCIQLADYSIVLYFIYQLPLFCLWLMDFGLPTGGLQQVPSWPDYGLRHK